MKELCHEALLADLMVAAQGGNRRAYRALLHVIARNLRQELRLRFRDCSEAEDVVRDVLLAVHRNRSAYHPSRPFRSWLATIATKTIPSRSQRPEPETLPASGPVDDDAEFLAAVAALPDGQRGAVERLVEQDLKLLDEMPGAGKRLRDLLDRVDERLRKALGASRNGSGGAGIR